MGCVKEQDEAGIEAKSGGWKCTCSSADSIIGVYSEKPTKGVSTAAEDYKKNTWTIKTKLHKELMRKKSKLPGRSGGLSKGR